MRLRRNESEPVVEMLQKTSLWAGLSKQDLKRIARLSKERRYESGETVVRKGEGGVGFYLILDGAVEVRSDGTTLSKLGPGQFFGEMSLLDDQPRSADVVVIEPARCLTLSAWSFKALISENPRVALKMLQELVRRLRTTDKALSD